MWESINRAWSSGYERVSFGRQMSDPENPRFQNKVKFGAEQIPIHSRRVLLSKSILMAYKVTKMLSD